VYLLSHAPLIPSGIPPHHPEKGVRDVAQAGDCEVKGVVCVCVGAGPKYSSVCCVTVVFVAGRVAILQHAQVGPEGKSEIRHCKKPKLAYLRLGEVKDVGDRGGAYKPVGQQPAKLSTRAIWT
jgi:hypothetical protein